MRFFKKKFLCLLIFITAISLYSIEIETALTSQNFVFNKAGVLPKIPNFGFYLNVSEDLGKNIHGSLRIKHSAGFGNIILSRIAYVTNTIKISAGPTLGFLNGDYKQKNFLALFQPGLGTEMAFITPKGFFAVLDTNFAIPLVAVQSKNIYLQDGFLEIGWNFPNLEASLKVSQKNKTYSESKTETYLSITDLGFYTCAYSKPSHIRIPLNFFCRLSRYDKNISQEVKKEILNIVLQTGFTHVVSTEIEWFINFAASVFSIDLVKNNQPISDFLFDANAGIKFYIGLK